MRTKLTVNKKKIIARLFYIEIMKMSKVFDEDYKVYLNIDSTCIITLKSLMIGGSHINWLDKLIKEYCLNYVIKASDKNGVELIIY